MLGALRGRGETVATAESLTGGLIGATLTRVPGASYAFRGGIIAYATDVKRSVLGVSGELLERHGAVHPDVAAQMARGAREITGSSYGVAVTGVAGPEPQDGQPVGTVYLGVHGPDGLSRVRALRLAGDREAIREATAGEALAFLGELLGLPKPEHPH
ncbi:CinA family protein [Bailinhaonella thermotolerans]|uniref:CinA family protein n=1 Tax=Bailinhaonella thermotolerans TaxID=1070861 RepID=A0A3A4ADY8_9ACTN|nr:CinA family protein [Bailinhaonella thermotolerans]RJL26651.1 CinA family protein [Bailinhaonella thermotolerans]